MKPGFEKMALGGQTLPPGFPAPFLFADGLNSVETLLTNIQVETHSLCHGIVALVGVGAAVWCSVFVCVCVRMCVLWCSGG